LANEGKIHSRFATADADVLASASAALVGDETAPVPVVKGEQDYMEEYEDAPESSEVPPAVESDIPGRDEL
jgi:UDP-glucose:glycoprotein glucosyltransferase